MTQIDLFLQQMLSHAIQSDVPHYLRAAKAYGGPILELGAGLGRTLLPLVDEGFNCVGIEHNELMVAHLQKLGS